MKTPTLLILITVLLAVSCTSQKKLAYLGNLPEPDGKETFRTVLPDYLLQPRDIVYVTAKALSTEGKIEDFFQSTSGGMTTQTGGESGGYLFGYDVNPDGYIRMPVIGLIKVAGLTMDKTREVIQEAVDKVFKNSTVECKLLSFKVTILGEVKAPGTYLNYNNYLTVLEAIGRAGGISDFGKRDRVLVVRATDQGSKTYRLNLQDKNILNSEAYFLLPNDVVIVEQQPQKVFYQNLTTIGFIISSFTSTLTTTLLLINYLK
jgi:polysaccharide biosynthesis/export protein